MVAGRWHSSGMSPAPLFTGTTPLEMKRWLQRGWTLFSEEGRWLQGIRACGVGQEADARSSPGILDGTTDADDRATRTDPPLGSTCFIQNST